MTPTVATQPSTVSLLSRKLRIVRTLILREIKLELRTSKLGYLLVLFEPAMQFAVMFAIFSFVGHRPAFGTSLGLFLATGLVPYFIFMHLAQRTMGAVRSARAFAKVPTVSAFDNALARGTLEFLSLVIFTVVIFAILIFLGFAPVPAKPSVLVAAVLSIGLTAFGVGLVNGVLTHLSRTYALIWSVLSRSLLFFSGVFYMPTSLPPVARDVVLWNPILHGVEWLRLGVFASYPIVSLSQEYLLIWGIGSITLGLVLLRVFSGHLLR